MSPQIKRAASPATGSEARTKTRRGFTLVELLVSMAVLLLVMAMTVQLVGRATSISSNSDKYFDAAAMARIVFDRLSDDLSGAALTGGPTLLYYSGSDKDSAIDVQTNSALGFVCKTRARKNSTIPDAVLQDVRGTVVGYKIRPTSITLRAGTAVSIPLINRGDAEFTYQKSGSAGTDGKYGYSTWDMFGLTSATSLPKDLMATAGDTNLLAWQGFGDGVLRFHVSFVLDDGRIVQRLSQPGLNATYLDFQTTGANGGTGNCLPVALSAATSADANKHYVTGLIVGIVVLDQASLNARVAQDPNTFVSNLVGQLKRPTADTETPLKIWQANLDGVNPLPVRQSIRLYQRFYAVGLQ